VRFRCLALSFVMRAIRCVQAADIEPEATDAQIAAARDKVLCSMFFVVIPNGI